MTEMQIIHYIIICEAASDLLCLRPDHLGVVTSRPRIFEWVNVIGVVSGGLNLKVPGQGGLVSHGLHQLKDEFDVVRSYSCLAFCLAYLIKSVLVAAPLQEEVLTRLGAIRLVSVFIMLKGALIRPPGQD